eukprot:59909_1
MEKLLKATVGRSIECSDGTIETFNENRSSVYQWCVVCTVPRCAINDWDNRMTWRKYNDHYNAKHKDVDSWAKNKKGKNKKKSIMENTKRSRLAGLKLKKLVLLTQLLPDDDENRTNCVQYVGQQCYIEHGDNLIKYKAYLKATSRYLLSLIERIKEHKKCSNHLYFH